MDLFEANRRAEPLEQAAPLPARMRPRSLAEIVGHEEVIGEGTLLRQAIERDQLISLVLWGPPGSGKTTLASIIASGPAPIMSHQRGFIWRGRVALDRAQGGRPAGHAPPADGPVHRRDPSVQQGPTGRNPSLCRRRHRHPDWSDHPKSLLRSESPLLSVRGSSYSNIDRRGHSRSSACVVGRGSGSWQQSLADLRRRGRSW